jgi:RimJ/RimL family protein N-acetyltransferase
VKYDFSQDPVYLQITNDILGNEAWRLDDQNVYTIAIFSDDSEFLAVAVYNNFRGTDCSMHIASASPKWATRASLKVLAAYPFWDMGVRRVSTGVPEKLVDVQNMLLRLGFVKEGELRDYYEDGTSRLLFGLTKDECRWI